MTTNTTEPPEPASGVPPGMVTVDALDTLVPMRDAVDALQEALAGGLDVEAAPPRSIVEVPAGQLLMMPAAHASYAGVKVATVAPANPQRGLPRIHGLYILLDGRTLAPLRMLEGIALTSLRTPAVSALAASHLAVPDASRLVVFGTGPQAWGHVRALRAVRPIQHVAVVARDEQRRAEFVRACTEAGLDAERADAGAVATADLVACCTTAREPLFPARALREEAMVIAMGSHEPDAREVGDDVVARCGWVAVEARSAAMREAGDVIQAVRAGVLDSDSGLRDLGEVVRGEATPQPGRPRMFKGTGMAWEDLVVAALAHERSTKQGNQQ